MCISHTANQTLGCLFMFEHRSVSSWESYIVIFFLAPTWGVPNLLDMPKPPRTHGNTTVTRWPRGGHASVRALELGPSAPAQTSTYHHQTMYLLLNRSLCNYKWFLEKKIANNEAAAVQIWPASNWIGGNLSFSREVDQNFLHPTIWSIVH